MHLSVLIPTGGLVDSEIWRANSFAWLRRRYGLLLPEAELVFGTSEQVPYNRSEARNNAFAASTGDILLVADADTIFHRDQIVEAVRLVMEGAPWVIPYRLGGYYNFSEAATARVLAHAPDVDIPEPVDEDDWEFKLDSWAGLHVLTRAAWEKAGGWDEAFRGWSFEDNAFQVAMDRLVGQHVRTDHWVGHLWHPATEAERFGQPFMEHNRRRFRLYQRGVLP